MIVPSSKSSTCGIHRDPTIGTLYGGMNTRGGIEVLFEAVNQPKLIFHKQNMTLLRSESIGTEHPPV